MNTNDPTTTQPGSPDTPASEASAQLGEIKSLLGQLAAETEELKRAAGGSLADALADWVAAQYLLAIRREIASQPDGPERLKLLRQAAGDAVALQRGNHWSARVKLEREKLALAQQKHQHAVAQSQPDARPRPDYLRPLTDEERLAIIDKVDHIFGLK